MLAGCQLHLSASGCGSCSKWDYVVSDLPVLCKLQQGLAKGYHLFTSPPRPLHAYPARALYGGFGTHDPNLWVPNGLGAMLAVVQVNVLSSLQAQGIPSSACAQSCLAHSCDDLPPCSLRSCCASTMVPAKEEAMQMPSLMPSHKWRQI